MPTLPVLAPTFDDEFSSFVSSPRGGSTGWATELPFWSAEHTLSGNHEAEYYVNSAQTNSPFSNQDGVLTIQATPAAVSGANPLGLAYNSGAITTYKSFSQLYGYFEVRAQLPSGAGLWPAFWLMPTNFKPGPELDVFEVLGDQPDVLNSSVHSINTKQALLQCFTVADTSAAFHTYGVDWEPQQTTYYVDGKIIGAAATPADMNVPMYMILNLAVGGPGSWPGAPTANTTFPANLKIDYVHAYQTAGTIGWSDSTPEAPAPLVLPALQAGSVYGNAQAYVNVQHYGNQDGGSPLGGIGVALRNVAGLIVATGVTDVRGFYTFLNLAPGTYRIQYFPPQQYSIRAGNFADPSTGLTSSFTLTSGQNLAVPYQLMTSSAELAGTVQLDGLSAANIVVKLLDQNGNTLSTTLTDSTGRFNFWTAAGEYAVEYDPPTGTKLAAGSLADLTTGRTAPIALADGQAFLLIPEQLVSVPSAVSPIPMAVSLMSDTGVSALDGLTKSPGIAGVGLANGVVTVRSGTSVLGTTTADSHGRWSFMPTNLADGSYTLTASQVDAAGNTASGSLTLVLDTTAPGTTVSLANDTGSSNGDRITSSAVLTGGGDAGAVVTLRKGETVLGTTTADGKGQWTYSPPGLSNGTFSLTATETDAAGNSSTAVIAITLDTIAPKPVTKIITGVAGGRITLAGVSEANSLVTVTDTTSSGRVVLGTATTAGNGAWSLTSQAAVDMSKVHTYTTSAADLAGNSGVMPGSFILADNGIDVLRGNAAVSDVFAFMSFKGTDVVKGFEASSVVGANHDYIDFSGRGITSFGQVQSMMSGTTSTVINIGAGKMITIADVAPSLFTAADFRYS